MWLHGAQNISSNDGIGSGRKRVWETPSVVPWMTPRSASIPTLQSPSRLHRVMFLKYIPTLLPVPRFGPVSDIVSLTWPLRTIQSQPGTHRMIAGPSLQEPVSCARDLQHRIIHVIRIWRVRPVHQWTGLCSFHWFGVRPVRNSQTISSLSSGGTGRFRSILIQEQNRFPDDRINFMMRVEDFRCMGRVRGWWWNVVLVNGVQTGVGEVPV